MAVSVFLDTSVLVAGFVDFGAPSGPAQDILAGVAGGRSEGNRDR